MLRNLICATAILIGVTGCGPGPGSTSGQNADRLQTVQHSERADPSADRIANDIVGKVVRISELRGALPEDEWTFEAKEFRRVEVMERKATANGLALVIFVTTRNIPGPDEDQIQVSGKLLLEYEWKADRWALKTIENLTFRYSVGTAT